METSNQILDFLYILVVCLYISIRDLLGAFITIFGSLLILALPFILLFLILAFVITFFIVNLVARGLYMKAYNAYLSGNYDVVISKGKKITTWYYIISKTSPFPSVRRIIDDLNGMLAVSFLAKEDNEKFLKHINAIKRKKAFKSSWLCMYYLLHNDVQTAEGYYESLKETNEAETTVNYLNAIFLFKQGEIEQARKTMNEVYPKLNVPFAKAVADNMFSKDEQRE